MTIENQIEQLAGVTTFVEELGEELGLSVEHVFNFNLVLEEAMTNVIMYAYPEGETHEIWLTAIEQDGVVTFRVEDEGTAFDPTAVPDADVTLSAEERAIGGLGIFLIRQLMDEVEYQRVNGRNQLTMKKKL